MNAKARKSNYFLKYGLERDPFPVNNIDEVLFLTPELNRRLKLIEFVIEYSQELLVITSAVGAGKTVLANHVESLKSDNWRVSTVQAKPGTDPSELAGQLLENALPRGSDTAVQPEVMLKKYLEHAFNEDILPVFVVDDAHLLPLATLEFILQMIGLDYNETQFRIALFADERIHDLFEESSKKTLALRILQKIHIPSFSFQQTSAYIKHRFSMSGNASHNPFTEQDIYRIYKVTGGLARGINTLARELLIATDKKGPA